MPEYIYIIHPIRHGTFANPMPDEQTVLKERVEYLEKAQADGILITAGICLDETFGFVIFNAIDNETARTFMFNDPSIKNNIMVAELHPLSALYRENK